MKLVPNFKNRFLSRNLLIHCFKTSNGSYLVSVFEMLIVSAPEMVLANNHYVFGATIHYVEMEALV